MDEHPYNQYFHTLKPVLTSKTEELFLLGYGKIANERLWSYLLKKKWKYPESDIRFSALVNDVLAVKPGEFMNFQTVDAFRSSNWFKESDKDDLHALLHGEKTK
ncbi:post-transcriptional regulator [Bacillus sp. 2205SS5-2]|uniref:post-transcriptional regulator n=1 Tax=Bacillus sp. 2205SS5-2 TaxID=3109031 RepID=UPI003004F4CE